MEIKTISQILKGMKEMDDPLLYGMTCQEKWVYVEDILKVLNDDSITCFEDLKDYLEEELKNGNH